MKPVWEIDGSDVQILQGDSARFVRFLNAVLSFQASAGHLPIYAVHLNQKDPEKDGGVNAVVIQGIAAERDPTGWFQVPTCWQFKARPTRNIRPKKGKTGGQQAALRQFLLDDPAVRRLVGEGFGYRLCIAADMPSPKKSSWEAWLLAAAREVNVNAPAPYVLTASDLAIWANSSHSIVIDFFRPYLGPFLSLERWRGEIAGLTPEFVAISGWDAAIGSIREHVDFSRRVTSVLTVHGEAGVGKTRCTCESLLNHAAHQGLVIYSVNENKALEFAQIIARDERERKAILVSDECSLESRVRLGQIVKGCADRLRVIAIDNSLQRVPDAGEVRLTQMSVGEVEAILATNFPTILAERRLGYARLAQGFVRLAVDLCEHDALVPADGRVDSVFGFFRDHYLQRRLKPEELDAVQLVSLLPRVGYRDEVSDQLERLCNHPMIGLRKNDVVGVATRLRQSPGFIAFGGRYLYITPMLIAQVAFQSAWDRWIGPDPRRFLAEFPADLIDSLAERSQAAATPAMRDAVSDFFLDWVRNLGPADLGREGSVARLARLVEVQPPATHSAGSPPGRTGVTG